MLLFANACLSDWAGRDFLLCSRSFPLGPPFVVFSSTLTHSHEALLPALALSVSAYLSDAVTTIIPSAITRGAGAEVWLLCRTAAVPRRSPNTRGRETTFGQLRYWGVHALALMYFGCTCSCTLVSLRNMRRFDSTLSAPPTYMTSEGHKSKPDCALGGTSCKKVV